MFRFPLSEPRPWEGSTHGGLPSGRLRKPRWSTPDPGTISGNAGVDHFSNKDPPTPLPARGRRWGSVRLALERDCGSRLPSLSPSPVQPCTLPAFFLSFFLVLLRFFSFLFLSAAGGFAVRLAKTGWCAAAGCRTSLLNSRKLSVPRARPARTASRPALGGRTRFAAASTNQRSGRQPAPPRPSA